MIKQQIKTSIILILVLMLVIPIITAVDFGSSKKAEYTPNMPMASVGAHGLGQSFKIGNMGYNANLNFTGFVFNFTYFTGTSTNCTYILSNANSTGDVNATNQANYIATKVTNCSEFKDNINKTVNLTFGTSYLLTRNQYYFVGVNTSFTGAGTINFARNTTKDTYYTGGKGFYWDDANWLEVTPPSDLFFQIWGFFDELILNIPINNYKTSLKAVTFNCSGNTANQNENILNLTLIINGAKNYTISNTTNNQTYLNLITTQNIANYGNYNWSCLLTTDLQNIYSDNRTFDINQLIENSQTYNANAVQGTTQTFILNVTTELSINSAYLYYNATPYLATDIVTNGNDKILTKQLTIPYSLANSNQTFFWSLNLGGVNVNSSLHSQLVSNISLDDCSSYSNMLYNFTLLDEELRTMINATDLNSSIQVDIQISPMGSIVNPFITYSHTYSKINPAQVCMNNVLNGSLRIDMVTSYVANGYVQEFYYIDNGTINNQSIGAKVNDLHDLLAIDSTSFLFDYKDKTNLKVPGAIVHVWRYYVGDGLFREVERAKQDNSGETNLHLVEEDVIYIFMVTLNGQWLYNSTQYTAKCLSTPCSISLRESGGVDWSLINNNAENFVITKDKVLRTTTLTFSLESVSLINYTLYKSNDNGITLINTTSVTGSNGVLTLPVLLAYGNVTFYVDVYRDNIFIKRAILDFRESGFNYFGNSGIVLGGLIILTLGLMAVSSGVIFIIALLFGVVMMVIMQLVDLSWLSVTSLICAGFIIIIKLVMRRRQYG